MTLEYILLAVIVFLILLCIRLADHASTHNTDFGGGYRPSPLSEEMKNAYKNTPKPSNK